MSGKTTIVNTLAQALEKVKVQSVNPKALTIG
jgi:uridine kinase